MSVFRENMAIIWHLIEPFLDGSWCSFKS